MDKIDKINIEKEELKNARNQLLEYRKQIAELSEEEQKQRDLYLSDLATGKIQGPPTGFPSLDKPWLKYYSEDKIVELTPNKSVYQYAFDSNKNNLDNVAIDIRISKDNFKHTISKITYRDFFKNVKKSADSLESLDVKQDEIVPLILPNIPEARYLIYANSFNGSISYPISPLLPSKQLENIVKENNVSTIFIFDMFYDKYKDFLKNSNIKNIIVLNGSESLPFVIKKIMNLKKINKKTNDKRVKNWDEFINLGKNINDNNTPYYSDNHVTAIIGTSGTTGTSKGVCLTDKSINTVAMAYKNGEYFEGTFLDALIPSIGYGISMIHYQTVDGRYVYLIPELITDKFPIALKNTRANNFPGGPVHFINLDKAGYERKDIPFAYNLISGGATLPKNVEKKLNKVDEKYAENNAINDDLIVRQGYGLSENTAMGAYNKRGSYKFGSIGIPIIYENIGVFEPNSDIELGNYELGEICINSDSMMKEYLNNKEETDKIIIKHSDGKKWIHTKDIGYIDDDGNIFHVDRIKNIFMRCGFNVHPSKIAEFILTIPEVDECCVIGFEHPDEQNVPVAFIKLKSNLEFNQSEIIEKIKNECFQNLEEPSIPYEFKVVENLPINVGGKVDINKIKSDSKINYMSNKNNNGKVLIKN